MSSTTYGPPVPIDGPPPVRYPYGILSVARELTQDERAAMGVTILPYPPDVPYGFDPCAPGTFREKAVGSDWEAPLFPGFTAYTPVTCNSKGIGSDAEFRRKVSVALEQTDQHILERQLVSGEVLPDYTHVGAAGVDVISATGVSPAEAIFMLEDAIATTGRKGVIGLTPGAVGQAGFNNLRITDGHLETANGTPVIAGQGFVGQAPAGGAAASDTEQWAWAMGPVFYWRGEVYIPGDRAANTDRVTNVTTYRAERELVVGWDGILRAAVLVDSAA
jgi:hypothetical protein